MGLRAKNSRSPSVQVHYLVHIIEIKPWPPSQSLRSLRSVLIQWENGDRNSGSTNLAVPSLGSVVGEGKIEFNESFKLNATMLRDTPVRGGDADRFQRNILELHLYEPRRDKTAKGLLLATAAIDLADYGILKEAISVSAPMNCKRSYGNTNQPLLFLKIRPTDKKRNEASLRSTLSKELSMESNGRESVSALMDEEYAEEADVASSTDDDVSSYSSRVISPSVESNESLQSQQIRHKKAEEKTSFSSSMDLSSDSPTPMGLDTSSIKHQIVNGKSGDSSSCTSSVDLPCDISDPTNGGVQLDGNHCTSDGYSSKEVSSASLPFVVGRPASEQSGQQLINTDNNGKNEETEKAYREEDESIAANCSSSMNLNDRPSDMRSHVEDDLSDSEISKDQLSVERYDKISMSGSVYKNERLKHVKSVRSLTDTTRSSGSLIKSSNGVTHIKGSERKDGPINPKDARNSILDRKVLQLEDKIKLLEGELREAAAIEVALYSVVAEHGSSMNKVHAPARRLSRLYLHAQKETLRTIRAGAARSAISGLVLVAKACGNDVPRLTFWLSNAIMLRTIISQTTESTELLVCARSSLQKRDEGRKSSNISSSLKWESASPKTRNTCFGDLSNWGDHATFISALENVESWIFTRIVDSIWWQTLTPYMQPVHQKATDNSRSSMTMKDRRLLRSSNQEQEQFSLDLWKKAFRDAYERLCPVRAEGHDCGCLPVLAKLVMEQCVARLDVAMFNAILRESAEDIPTDPVSDPISNPMVLPVPSGKTSFGAGAQLKNVIGNWSMWLSNMFGVDDDDSHEETHNDDEDDERQNPSFKCFFLLNSLSDLLMLPKDMLLSRSIRKEVCPNFGVLLIKRILDNFVPDEFCPDPIPKVVLEALDAEDPVDGVEGTFANFPCTAAPILYTPPSAASIVDLVGDTGGHSRLRRSGSSLISKSNTSDDELDELKSPLSSIVFEGSRSSTLSLKSSWKANEIRNGNAVRYDLLKELWNEQ